MFARLVDAKAKPGKKDEIFTILTNELAPLLKKQQGFVDVVGLIGHTNLEEGATLTFWKAKTDAETFYKTPEFTKIMERITPRRTHEYPHVQCGDFDIPQDRRWQSGIGPTRSGRVPHGLARF